MVDILARALPLLGNGHEPTTDLDSELSRGPGRLARYYGLPAPDLGFLAKSWKSKRADRFRGGSDREKNRAQTPTVSALFFSVLLCFD